MVDRGVRDRVVVATKVGAHPDHSGLSRASVCAACEASLRRLQTDRIDLYLAHFDDHDTPQEETAEVFDALVQEGKVRAVAASNFTRDRLESALRVQREGGWAPYVALQPAYNLVSRRTYERELADLCVREGLSVLPYSGLASGFLTGKYRAGGEAVDSVRSGSAAKYLDRGGAALLEVLDDVAGAHGVAVAAVALAWLRARPAVAAPLASARTPKQLEDILPALTLSLSDEEVQRLTAASDPVAGMAG